MPNPLNMPVILIGTPFVEQAHQQVVQQSEVGLRDGILRVDQLIDQERNEVQQLLPSENPEIREKTGGNPRRRRRRREKDETAAGSEQPQSTAGGQEEEGKGKVVDLEA